jgi:uncharacterized protein (DUF488 family)
VEKTIYTVGHSTRSLDELVALLSENRVAMLVDVRSVPRSRRHPHFGAEELAASLPREGVHYRHEPILGGFRRPRADSPNGGWTHAAFQGYADHMASPEFLAALRRLEELARTRSACVMCAEAQWWRCHRRLISDALVVRGWVVLHLGLGGAPAEHELTSFAVVDADLQITYPPPQPELELEDPGHPVA